MSVKIHTSDNRIITTPLSSIKCSDYMMAMRTTLQESRKNPDTLTLIHHDEATVRKLLEWTSAYKPNKHAKAYEQTYELTMFDEEYLDKYRMEWKALRQAAYELYITPLVQILDTAIENQEQKRLENTIKDVHKPLIAAEEAKQHTLAAQTTRTTTTANTAENFNKKPHSVPPIILENQKAEFLRLINGTSDKNLESYLSEDVKVLIPRFLRKWQEEEKEFREARERTRKQFTGVVFLSTAPQRPPRKEQLWQRNSPTAQTNKKKENQSNMPVAVGRLSDIKDTTRLRIPLRKVLTKAEQRKREEEINAHLVVHEKKLLNHINRAIRRIDNNIREKKKRTNALATARNKSCPPADSKRLNATRKANTSQPVNRAQSASFAKASTSPTTKRVLVHNVAENTNSLLQYRAQSSSPAGGSKKNVNQTAKNARNIKFKFRKQIPMGLEVKMENVPISSYKGLPINIDKPSMPAQMYNASRNRTFENGDMYIKRQNLNRNLSAPARNSNVPKIAANTDATTKVKLPQEATKVYSVNEPNKSATQYKSPFKWQRVVAYKSFVKADVNENVDQSE